MQSICKFAVSTLVVCAAMLPAEASGQTIDAALRASLGRHGLGLEIETGVPRAALFIRGQSNLLGWFQILTFGGRVWALGDAGHGIYAYTGYSLSKCSRYSIGGYTGCDGESHSSYQAGAGIEAGAPPSAWSAFMEGGSWLKDRELREVPEWTFAAGVRYRMNDAPQGAER